MQGFDVQTKLAAKLLERTDRDAVNISVIVIKIVMTSGSFLFISYRSEKNCTSLYFANKNFIFYICSRRSKG